jgi:hypothetical protein
MAEVTKEAITEYLGIPFNEELDVKECEHTHDLWPFLQYYMNRPVVWAFYGMGLRVFYEPKLKILAVRRALSDGIWIVLSKAETMEEFITVMDVTL